MDLPSSFFLSLLTGPVLAALFAFVYLMSGGKIVFRLRIDRKKDPGTISIVSAILFPIWLTFCFFVFMGSRDNIFGTLDDLKWGQEASRFCDWFDSIDRQLYAARSVDDPVIKKVQDRLDEEQSNLTFRLGPYQDGRRELAFTQSVVEGRSYKTTAGSLIREFGRRANPRWYVGWGVQQKPKGQNAIQYAVGNVGVLVDYRDFYFKATRNRNLIGLEVYTDVSIPVSSGAVTPVCSFVEGYLGEQFFGSFLGKVQVKKIAELKDKEKAQTVDHIYQAFLNLLSSDEQKDLNSKVTSYPCVSEVIGSGNSYSRPFSNQQVVESPFLYSRHKHEQLVPALPKAKGVN
jgi:hypothetical protein